MNDLVAKPVASATVLSEPYWQGLQNGKLLLQACAGCGVLRHYPRLLCDRCYSDGVHWQAACGRGLIHSWTVAHHAFHPGFAEDLPYTLVTVALVEGPRALGRWWGAAAALDLPVRARFDVVGTRVELAFEPDPDDR